MPGGYAELVAIIGLYTLLVLWPPRRPRAVAVAVFFISHLINELPGFALGALVAGTALELIRGDLASAGGLPSLVLAALTAVGLLEVARRGLMTASVVEQSLDQGLGLGQLAVPTGGLRWRRLARELLAPLPLCPLNVQRIRNVSYGDAGRCNRRDIYRCGRSAAGAGPVLIHLHGGHFQIGGKSREARQLLHRFARVGWECISATYRLGAPGRFPNSLIDAKHVITWVRSHAAEYGADPSAAVCLYGYYGERDAAARLPSSPGAYLSGDAPPLLVVHGENDTLIPIGHADHFVQRLRHCSTRPAVYFRLPGAGHSFDLFASPRFDVVIDGIQAFAEWVQGNRHKTLNGAPNPMRGSGVLEPSSGGLIR